MLGKDLEAGEPCSRRREVDAAQALQPRAARSDGDAGATGALRAGPCKNCTPLLRYSSVCTSIACSRKR